jgi:hypothetical protein
MRSVKYKLHVNRRETVCYPVYTVEHSLNRHIICVKLEWTGSLVYYAGTMYPPPMCPQTTFFEYCVSFTFCPLD